MRIPAVAALMVSLGACGDGPAQEPGGEEMSSRAEADGGSADATYAQMKEAAALFAQEEYSDRPPLEPEEDYLTGEMAIVYDVVNCGEEFENIEVGEVDPQQEELEKLARRVARHEHYLSQLFDPSVYREPLAAFEDDYRQLIAVMPPRPHNWDEGDPAWQRYNAWESRSWELYTRLAEALEARHSQDGIAIRADGGCGAGESPYSIATSPAGGTVWLTTKFSFDLCGVRGRDRWDTEDCRWTEIGSPDETQYLSGRYAYQARWSDGLTRRGIRNFSPDDFTPGEFDPVRVTIAAQ